MALYIVFCYNMYVVFVNRFQCVVSMVFSLSREKILWAPVIKRESSRAVLDFRITSGFWRYRPEFVKYLYNVIQNLSKFFKFNKKNICDYMKIPFAIKIYRW
jgi:hypothetical protein